MRRASPHDDADHRLFYLGHSLQLGRRLLNEQRRILPGCDQLFLMRPDISDVQRFPFPRVAAAREVGVRQIAVLSFQGVQARWRTSHDDGAGSRVTPQANSWYCAKLR